IGERKLQLDADLVRQLIALRLEQPVDAQQQLDGLRKVGFVVERLRPRKRLADFFSRGCGSGPGSRTQHHNDKQRKNPVQHFSRHGKPLWEDVLNSRFISGDAVSLRAESWILEYQYTADWNSKAA